MTLLLAVALLAGASSPDASPPSTYIDRGACPFECCVYREWRTLVDTVLRARPDPQATVVGRARAGAVVQGITGEVHARPVAFVVRSPHGRYRPGDTLWVYSYVGEGRFKVWHEGAMLEEDLGFSPYGGSPGARCDKRTPCWGELEGELRFRWWVKVQGADGQEGWTDRPEHFGNKDACG